MSNAQHRTCLASPLARAATKTDEGRLTEVAGLAVPYLIPTNIGYFTETVHPGAFTESIRAAKNGIPLLALHDSSRLDCVLGRAMAGDFTETRAGLHVRFTLNSSDAAQDAAQLARDGGLGYLSIGFQPIKITEHITKAGDLIVDLHEGRLLEVSLVSTPAYVSAAVDHVRSALIDPGAVATAALQLAAGDPDTATQIYVACLDPGLAPAQRDAVSAALIRWAPAGPRYLRHAIGLTLDDAETTLPAGALARLGIALARIRGTTEQETASAAAIRRDYLGDDATRPRTLAVSRRRRRTA